MPLHAGRRCGLDRFGRSGSPLPTSVKIGDNVPGIGQRFRYRRLPRTYRSATRWAETTMAACWTHPALLVGVSTPKVSDLPSVGASARSNTTVMIKDAL